VLSSSKLLSSFDGDLPIVNDEGCDFFCKVTKTSAKVQIECVAYVDTIELLPRGWWLDLPSMAAAYTKDEELEGIENLEETRVETTASCDG